MSFLLKNSTFAHICASRFDNSVSLDNLLQVEEVFTCVKIISETIASMPLTLKRKIGNNIESANEHPVSKLLRRMPNPYTTAYQLKQWLVIDYLTANFGVAIITRDGNGTINGIWQQNAKDVKPERNEATNYDLFYNVNLASVGNVAFNHKKP